ncbi:MAG TPA: glycoside hydrolase family 43 protein [Candidatus Pelethenecus sp.]|nr:glycoside hydrolase family 43 protein [Candidatus Pelethenecus sp.]
MIVKNPILTGFNPDPAICKAKDTYYIATSTFETFPGLNIYESKDLVNWKLIAHPLGDKFIDMTNNVPSSGVWAPDITYKDGIFYIVFSNVQTWSKGPFKDCFNYIISAESIYGPWSDPYLVNASGFDASLFHDEDGKSYFVNMEWDFRKGKGNPCFTGILVQEIDLERHTLVGQMHKVFRGTERGFVEGPHIYKKDGYYYLFCAEGGTGYNHAESVSRSTSIFGPYESHPDGLLISAKDTDASLQRAGHASLVDGGENGWYIAHLCSRPLNGRCILGRETALQNIIWKKDWPYLAHGSSVPREYYEVKNEIEPMDFNQEIHYDFLSKQFELDFQTLRIDMSPYAKRTKETLTLIGKQSFDSTYLQNTWQRRQQHFCCTFGCKLSYEPDYFGHLAGLIYRYQEGDLYLLYSTFDEEKGKVLRMLAQHEYETAYYPEVCIPYAGDIYLKIVVRYKEAQFYYSLDGKYYQSVGDVLDATMISDQFVKHGGFTGAFLGLYTSDSKYANQEATFSNVYYKKLEDKEKC